MLRFDAEGGRIADKAPTGRVLIDGTRVGEVGDEVLRDRRHLATDGLVVPVVAINAQTGVIEGVPELVARGFVSDDGTADLLADGARVLATMIDECGVEERTDPGLMKERIRVELRTLPQEANRTAPDGAAGGDGDLGREAMTRAILRASVSLSRRVSEVVGVALFAAALIWLIALASYDPNDPVWFFSTGTNEVPANFVGRVGAFLSELSFQVLGYALVPGPGALAVARLALLLVPADRRGVHEGDRRRDVVRVRQRDAEPDARPGRLRAAAVRGRRLPRRMARRRDVRVLEPHRIDHRDPHADRRGGDSRHPVLVGPAVQRHLRRRCGA